MDFTYFDYIDYVFLFGLLGILFFVLSIMFVIISEKRNHFELYSQDIPCWSLVALFNLFDWPKLSTSSMGDGSIGVMISAYPNGYRHDSSWFDNPIDACVEMALKLHEQKLL